MELTTAVIGVDVGGTNTDAAILTIEPAEECSSQDNGASSKPKVIGKAKTATTFDVTTGVKAAIHLALINTHKENRELSIKQVNIGTTHFINAVVQGKGLEKAAIIRLCGTASRKVLPFADITESIARGIKGSVFLVNGGYQFDGREITPVDEAEIVKCVETLKERKEKNIVISGIFSPVRDNQEKEVAEIIKAKYPEASLTLSHEIGKVGLLERENAAILNESIKPLCLETIKGFRAALDDLGLKCPMYLTQNDGTIISEEKATKYPVLTFASGATNSMRGAAFLSGVKEAVVIDIGGTSTDVGLLQKGFPREASSEVRVGGVRTNFRMPDVISIGLGGGSYVSSVSTDGKSCIKVGPLSAGYRIETEGLVFAKAGENLSTKSVTATDVAVAAGLSKVGNEENVKHLKENFVSGAAMTMRDMITACIDKMRFNDRKVPMILVGGGSIIVNKDWEFDGISEMLTPDHFDVANAVGAALSQISSSMDKVVDLGKYLETAPEAEDEQSRKEQLEKARDKALNDAMETVKKELCRTDVVEDTITLVEKDDVALSYIPGDATRIKIKMVGDLKGGKTTDAFKVPGSVYTTMPVTGSQHEKQGVSTTGEKLGDDSTLKIQSPKIDSATGEWIISEYDVECLSIGAGILGCGGGGSPHIARLLALAALKDGKKIRVVNPSRFLKDADPENDLITSVAYMGAPIVMYEKLVSGNETPGALECMQDLYSQGDYKDGNLQNAAGVEIVKRLSRLRYIKDYKRVESADSKTSIGSKKIIAIMSAEIGGMNCIEPLIVAAELGLPVLDCDGMGRAFPELQMFSPFIYGCKPYPSCLADDKGQRVATLYADGPKTLENHFREFLISMGCSAGIVLSHFNKEEILTTTVQHSLSRAWRIGDAILRARSENKPAVQALIDIEHGELLITAKVTDVNRETTGGFNKGRLMLEGIDAFSGKTIEVEFQNEYLIARDVECKTVLACVPDLVTLMDIDTAQPIPTEEVKFGIRVAVVGMRVSPVMSSDVALKVVGPGSFGYQDVVYTPVGKYVANKPVAPE